MDASLLITLVSLILALGVVVKVQSAPPGTPWSREAIWHSIRSGFRETEYPWPRPASYFTENIPKTWPIRSFLLVANEELAAMRRTLQSAQAVHLPADIIRSYDGNMRQAGRLLNRNADRVVEAARAGATSPQLEEALIRKQHSLERLVDALQEARGSLAALIVTGLEDQRDLDQVAHSLQAWSEALREVSADTAHADLHAIRD
ncbi:MAG TPA: hypothetical protein VGR22_08795 [Thermomicrobiales bacterium]|nr:hypothetical protein [Thermomicrobiales bacterium]